MEQMDFGNRISRLRQNKNMTQEQMAVRIGVTPQALSRWERGQSLPDIALLADVCRILEVSADELLGIEDREASESGNSRNYDVIWGNLRNCLEPLELVFGEKLVPVFMDGSYTEKIVEQRKILASEGILMPVVRVKDEQQLEEYEFRVLSYHRVLYSERLTCVNENTCEYMSSCLGRTVRENYEYILNQEIVKELTDNLQIKFPVLIGESVPERISYGLLTDILKAFVAAGNSMVYLEKVIEILDRALRKCPNTSVDKLVQIILEEIRA